MPCDTFRPPTGPKTVNKSIEITVSARQYEDMDDSLAAAAKEVAQERGLAGYDLSPRWEDEETCRGVIVLTIPRHAATAEELSSASTWEHAR